MRRGALSVLALALVLPAFSADYPSPWEPSPPSKGALALFPKHERVFLVEVKGGEAELFGGVARAKLPVKTPKSIHLVEVGKGFTAIGEVPCQVSGGEVWFPLPGLTRPGKLRRFLCFLDLDGDGEGEVERGLRKEPVGELRVRKEGGGIVVENEYFSARHPLKGGGGLLSSFAFKHSGKEEGRFFWGDRVYKRELGQFVLQADPEAEARVVEEGPVRAVIEARARYFDPRKKEPAPNGARAVYRYEYFCGMPLVHITARAFQDKPFRWPELHFFQLSIKGWAYPYWAGGERPREERFTGSKKTREVGNWAAMFNSEDAVGLILKGVLRVYDDPEGYCNYIHGPWLTWDGREEGADAWLYIGPSEGSFERAERWARRISHLPRVEVRELEGLSALRRMAAASPSSSGEARLRRWLASLALRDYASGKLKDEGALKRVGEIERLLRSFRRLGKFLLARTGEAVYISGDLSAFAFDAKSGGFLSIYDLRTGVEFVNHPQDSPPLWEVRVRGKGGKEAAVRSDEAGRGEWEFRALDGGRRLEALVRWPRVKVGGMEGEVGVEVKFGLVIGSALLRERIKVLNRLKEGGLWEVALVIKGLGRPGDLAIPRENWGRLHRGAEGTFGGSYPSGSWPMQFLSLTEGPSTLYLACHDGLSNTKGFRFKAGDDFRFFFPPPDMGVPGADYEQGFDVLIGPLLGDWFDACMVYRTWALNQRWMERGPIWKRKDMPRDFKRICVWIQQAGDPDEILKGMREALDFFKLPMGLHWYCWHQIPFDNDYPHYFPAKPGFKGAVARLVKRGVFVMPYINGRLWDSDTDDFPRALPYATKGPDGKFYIEIYGSGEKLVPMCPWTNFWGDKLVGIVGRLVREFGVNAVYIDQVAAAGPRLCFDRSHGHPLGGGHWWVDGYYRILRRIRAIAPGRLAMTSECNCEAYANYFDAFLIWTWRHPDMAPLYAAVYGDRILRFGSPGTGGDDDTAFRIKVGRDFLWGAQLGWMGFWLLDPKNREKAEFLRRMGELRREAMEFVGFGTFLRAPGWASPPPKVKCRWQRGPRKFEEVSFPALERAAWRAPDGRVGIAIVNFDRNLHLAEIRLEGLGLPRNVSLLPLKITRMGRMPEMPLPPGSKTLETCVPPSDGLVVSLLPEPKEKGLLSLSRECISEAARRFGLPRPRGRFDSFRSAIRSISLLEEEARERGCREIHPLLCHWRRLLSLEALSSEGVEMRLVKNLTAVVEGESSPVGSIKVRNGGRKEAKVLIRSLPGDPALGRVTPERAEFSLKPGREGDIPVTVSPPLLGEAPKVATARFFVSATVGGERWEFILPLHLRLLPQVEARISLPSRARAGEETTAVLSVKVNAKRPLPGRLLIDLPRGWSVEPFPSLPLSEFAPGEETRRLLLLRLPPQAKVGEERIRVRWAREVGSASLEVEPPPKVAHAKRLTKPPTVDGDLSDWPEGPAIVLDGREGNHLKGWRGPEDLSAKVRLAWDKKALHFGAEVADDVHRQPNVGFDIWRGDCIQIGFDPFMDTSKPGYDENDVEIGLALTKSGPQAFLWFPRPRPCPEVRLSVKRRGNLTIYEASIPWPLLKVKPLPGLALGFSFTVNESDTGKFDGWLEWTPGICGGKDATRFGVLRLLP